MNHYGRSTIALLLLLCFALFLVGCTTTDAFTSIGEEFENVASDSLLFIVTTDLLDNRESQKMEYAFIDALAEYGIVGISWIDLFPPVKEYKAKDYAERIDEHEIDLIVYVNLQDSLMESGAYVNSSGVYPYTESFVMFEFIFQHTNLENPILVTQITVDSGHDNWAHLNAAASKRAVEEYAMAAGIELLPDPESE